jgi:hypothetical protein
MSTTHPGENHLMPTANPRIQVTLKPSQHELIRRLAKLQGRSMSKVISELFDEIEPVYERVAVVLQAAKHAQSSANEGMRQAFEKAEGEMAPHVAAAMGQFDLLVTAFGTGAGAGEASSASSPSQASTPAPVTRGSGTPKPRSGRAPSAPIVTRQPLRKPRTLRDIRKPPGRSIGRKLGASIAAAVQRGPRRPK